LGLKIVPVKLIRADIPTAAVTVTLALMAAGCGSQNGSQSRRQFERVQALTVQQLTRDSRGYALALLDDMVTRGNHAWNYGPYRFGNVRAFTGSGVPETDLFYNPQTGLLTVETLQGRRHPTIGDTSVSLIFRLPKSNPVNHPRGLTAASFRSALNSSSAQLTSIAVSDGYLGDTKTPGRFLGAAIYNGRIYPAQGSDAYSIGGPGDPAYSTYPPKQPLSSTPQLQTTTQRLKGLLSAAMGKINGQFIR
jgi:hypothetical protein